mgnify:FL=1
MALISGFQEFLGSVYTQASPLTLTTGGSASIQETYEIENQSSAGSTIVLSVDGGTTWIALPEGQKITVLTQVTATPTIKLAGTGPVYRFLSVRSDVTNTEIRYRVRISAGHSARVV